MCGHPRLAQPAPIPQAQNRALLLSVGALGWPPVRTWRADPHLSALTGSQRGSLLPRRQFKAAASWLQRASTQPSLLATVLKAELVGQWLSEPLPP